MGYWDPLPFQGLTHCDQGFFPNFEKVYFTPKILSTLKKNYYSPNF